MRTFVVTFIAFRRVRVTNPNTGETKEKIRVVTSDNKEYTLLTDMSVESIKANRAELLNKVLIVTGEYGDYARFRQSEVLEDF